MCAVVLKYCRMQKDAEHKLMYLKLILCAACSSIECNSLCSLIVDARSTTFDSRDYLRWVKRLHVLRRRVGAEILWPSHVCDIL